MKKKISKKYIELITREEFRKILLESSSELCDGFKNQTVWNQNNLKMGTKGQGAAADWANFLMDPNVQADLKQGPLEGVQGLGELSRLFDTLDKLKAGTKNCTGRTSPVNELFETNPGIEGDFREKVEYFWGSLSADGKERLNPKGKPAPENLNIFTYILYKYPNIFKKDPKKSRGDSSLSQGVQSVEGAAWAAYKVWSDYDLWQFIPTVVYGVRAYDHCGDVIEIFKENFWSGLAALGAGGAMAYKTNSWMVNTVNRWQTQAISGDKKGWDPKYTQPTDINATRRGKLDQAGFHTRGWKYRGLKAGGRWGPLALYSILDETFAPDPQKEIDEISEELRVRQVNIDANEKKIKVSEKYQKKSNAELKDKLRTDLGAEEVGGKWQNRQKYGLLKAIGKSFGCVWAVTAFLKTAKSNLQAFSNMSMKTRGQYWAQGAKDAVNTLDNLGSNVKNIERPVHGLIGQALQRTSQGHASVPWEVEIGAHRIRLFDETAGPSLTVNPSAADEIAAAYEKLSDAERNDFVKSLYKDLTPEDVSQIRQSLFGDTLTGAAANVDTGLIRDGLEAYTIRVGALTAELLPHLRTIVDNLNLGGTQVLHSVDEFHRLSQTAEILEAVAQDLKVLNSFLSDTTHLGKILVYRPNPAGSGGTIAEWLSSKELRGLLDSAERTGIDGFNQLAQVSDAMVGAGRGANTYALLDDLFMVGKEQKFGLKATGFSPTARIYNALSSIDEALPRHLENMPGIQNPLTGRPHPGTSGSERLRRAQDALNDARKQLETFKAKSGRRVGERLRNPNEGAGAMHRAFKAARDSIDPNGVTKLTVHSRSGAPVTLEITANTTDGTIAHYIRSVQTGAPWPPSGGVPRSWPTDSRGRLWSVPAPNAGLGRAYTQIQNIRNVKKEMLTGNRTRSVPAGVPDPSAPPMPRGSGPPLQEGKKRINIKIIRG